MTVEQRDSTDKGEAQSSHRRREFLRSGLALGTVSIFGVSSASGNQSLDAISVANWHELARVRNKLDQKYELVADLDAESPGYEEHVNQPSDGWEPIGGPTAPFTGSFDGRNHPISDLQISRPKQEFVGLFGVVTGRIERVRMATTAVTGRANVGSLAGRNNGGTVRDSACDGLATGEARVGCLVGHNTGVVSESFAICEVTGTEGVGGLVGENEAGTLRGTTTVSGAPESVTGEKAVGGLVGRNRGQVTITFTQTTTTGETRVGGLIGSNETGDVTNSSARGEVSGRERVGGLIGHNHGRVTECFASGKTTGARPVGGFVGFNENSPITDSYYDLEATGQASGVGDGDGDVRGLLTANMQGQSVVRHMANFDFENTWKVVTDPPEYPELRWEESLAENQRVKREPDQKNVDEEGFRFGIGGAVLALGGAGYLWQRRNTHE